MRHWFLRRVDLDKDLIFHLIDNEVKHWNLKVHKILSRSHQVEPYEFTAQLMNIVDNGMPNRAKSLVRRTLKDEELRPWALKLFIFFTFPYQLLRYTWSKL